MASIQKWRVTGSVLALENRWAKVRRDSCVTPAGVLIEDYYYWEGGDFAQVFALTPDEHVLLVRQYKHGVKEIVLELPAGMISSSDGDALVTARRELLEETGFEAEKWQSMGVLNVSSAKSTTRAYPFLALGAHRVDGPSLDETEEIEVLLLPIPDLLDRITNGEVRDSNSLAACLLALKQLGRI